MRYLFTRFQDDFPRGDATADGRVSETVSRVKREQRNELPAAVGERQCRSGGACQRECAKGMLCISLSGWNMPARDWADHAPGPHTFPNWEGATGPRMRFYQSVTRT